MEARSRRSPWPRRSSDSTPALVYLTPIVGGLIADRWLGRTRTVICGALLMALGHFLMAFDASFLIALACLLAGVGCFKGNIASQVGALYAPDDPRLADAYQIYFLFINGAVIISPLITGTLGESVGWHYGFGAAGVGMLISLVIYVRGRRWLAPEPTRAHASRVARTPLGRAERKAVAVLLLILPVIAIGAVGNQEIFNAYLLWVPGHIDLVFFGHTMPTTWLITLDALVSVGSLAGVLAFWRLWSKRQRKPSEITKLTIGYGISVLGLLSLAAAALIAAHGHKARPGWILAFELLNSVGYANIFPIGLALYARVSPRALTGTMIAIYYLHLFGANNLVGWLGGLVERLSGVRFWLLHAALVCGAGIFMAIAARVFGGVLAPKK